MFLSNLIVMYFLNCKYWYNDSSKVILVVCSFAYLLTDFVNIASKRKFVPSPWS